MTKFTKTIIGICMAFAIVTSTFAGTSTNSTSLFNSDEVGLSIASGYNLGAAGNVNGSTAFTKPYTLNLNAGAFYFPWRYLGAEANVPFYQNEGVSVSEVQVGTIARLPLGSETPILKNIALYVGAGGVYNWQTDAAWAYIGKVGTELRLNKNWGVFVESQYRNCQFTQLENGNLSLNGGLRLVF